MRNMASKQFSGFYGLAFMVLLVSQLFFTAAHAVDLRIAAASDLRFVMPEIEEAFQEANPGVKTQVIYGASGRFYGQIRNGAPFDLYFSADMSYPQGLVESGFAHGPVVHYGDGQLALWHRSPASPGIEDLLRARRIAIANPQHAPYGRAAMSWLESLPEFGQLQPKLVYAESVSQAAHFVRSGSADIGVLAFSIAQSGALEGKGSFVRLPVNEYPQIQQGMVVTQRATGNAIAAKFAAFVQSAGVQTLLAKTLTSEVASSALDNHSANNTADNK